MRSESKSELLNFRFMQRRELWALFAVFAILGSTALVDAFIHVPSLSTKSRPLLTRFVLTPTCSWSNIQNGFSTFTCGKHGPETARQKCPESLNRRIDLLQRQSVCLEATNNRMSEGGNGGRPALAKILQKTQQIYVSVVTFLLTRLRMGTWMKPQFLLAFIGAFVLFTGVLKGSRPGSGQPARPTEVPYSSFLSQVKSGGIEYAQLSVSSVAYRSKDGTFCFTRIPRAPPDLVNMLDTHQA